VFGSERLTGALLDRLTHHVHILEMNGDSYRLKQSRRRQRQPQAAELSDTQTQALKSLVAPIFLGKANGGSA
jgi:IstB-like ATP binding protein